MTLTVNVGSALFLIVLGYALGRLHAWRRRTRIEREYAEWYHGPE